MPDNTGTRVLLVDDDASIREILTLHLVEQGFETVQAEDGIDALVKLREKLPDVVISDLQMPRMSGFEFLSVVRKRFPSMPAIILAGSIPKELPVELRAYRYFEKSARKLRQIVAAIQELIQELPEGKAQRSAPNVPVRVRSAAGGYVSIPCPECLRIFQAEAPASSKSVQRTAACTYCNANVAYLLDVAVSA